MYFWTEEGKRVSYKLPEPFDSGMFGSVYKLPDDKCLKVLNKGKELTPEILKLIRDLNLKNYYRIYEVLYSKTGKVRAYPMKFYEAADIDILVAPVSYTLTSLCGLYESITTLAEHMVMVSDLHTRNVILTSTGVIAVDTDDYYYSNSKSKEQIRMKNIMALKYLFEQLFLEALDEYHQSISSFPMRMAIQNTFKIHTQYGLQQTCAELSKFTTPIDYISNKSRR